MATAESPTATSILSRRFGYAFSEEHLMIRDAAMDFARRRVAPGAAERDEKREYPLELLNELATMGLLGARVPLDYGGAGADNVGYALAMEALGEADAALTGVVAASNLVARILAEYGTEAQRQRWLVPYCAGELGPAAFCLTEPDAGSDVRALKTMARPDGEGFVLDGSKMWITSGAYAGLFLVFARTAVPGGGLSMSCFMVERGAPGLEIGKRERTMGQRSSGTVMLHFDGCRVGRDQLVGELHGGHRVALGALGPGRIGIAALCLGLGEAALREGIAYAVERRAFGQRVADFQNSQFAIVDSRLELDSAWLLVLRAAFALDFGRRAAMETSMAKLAASETCDRIVDRMLQLHGGNGVSQEYPIERLYRDARVTRIYEGTSEIQRLVMAREVIPRG